MKYDVVVLTEDRYENPAEELDIYNNNVIVEDALLVNALISEGLSVGRFSWSNPNINWDNVKSVVFRTTWDYFERYSEFSEWLAKIDGKVRLFNSSKIIHWNIDKSYLGDLERKGIAIPPTQFIKKGDQNTLRFYYDDLGYDKIILKPNISGAARHTYKIDQSNLSDHEELFSELIAQEDFMIQEFQNNIHTKGEISLVVIGGKYTHAVLKRGKADDFRVQDDFGGTVHEYQPNAPEISFAEKCIASMDETPQYARVDLMWDNNDNLVLSELEMIEPELWFRRCPKAAIELARAIKKQL